MRVLWKQLGLFRSKRVIGAKYLMHERPFSHPVLVCVQDSVGDNRTLQITIFEDKLWVRRKPFLKCTKPADFVRITVKYVNVDQERLILPSVVSKKHGPKFRPG